jgi:hypothetical protein
MPTMPSFMIQNANGQVHNGNSNSIDTWYHLNNILQILQETNGYDPLKLLPIITDIVQNRETQQFGKKIAGGLAEKATARLIRSWLLDSNQASNAKSSQLVIR